MTERQAISICDEDTLITYLKPNSGEYKGSLITVYEDAYGNYEISMKRYREIIETLNVKPIILLSILYNLHVPEKEINEFEKTHRDLFVNETL